MGVPKLTIGTVTVKGDKYGDHTWPETMGVEAPRVVWSFPPDDAQALLDGPREVSITATTSEGKTTTWDRIIVVGEEHSPDKLIRSVILTNVLYYLPYAWTRAQYNLTVASGTLRQVVADGLPQAFLNPVSNSIYAPYSLKTSDDGTTGVPWTLDEIAMDVLARACKGHDFPEIKVKYLASKRTSSSVQRDIYVDAAANIAVGQTLGALGGLDIRVGNDGSLEIVNAYLGAEKSVVDAVLANYSLEFQGHCRWVSMSNIAPRAGKVLVTRYVELRADSWETEPGSTSRGDDAVWGMDNNPTMINVLRVTDPQVTTTTGVSAVPAGQSAVQGTLLPVDTYCPSVAALAASQTQPADGLPGVITLTRSYLLQGPGGQGSCSPLQSNALERQTRAQDNGQGYSDYRWAARDAAIRDGIRIRYKMNPVLSRQCIPGSIKAERAGLLDAATATRQPATVYMDYTQRPAGPGWAPSDKFGWLVNSIPGAGGTNDQAYPTGIKTYANDSYPDAPFLLSSAQPAPWSVSVDDSSTGVFSFAPTVNRELATAQTQTSAGLIWGLPTISPKEINRGNAIANWAQGKKLLTHRVALVFSAIPGGPNNAGALQTYDVTVQEALARLGAPSDAVTAKAPTKELRVREGTAFARIAWDDAQRQNILGCFSNNGVGDPSVLVPVNNPELQDFAVAVFANWLAAVLNHYEGTMKIGFSPGLHPVGSLNQVINTFGSDGRWYTSLLCRGVVPIPSPENLISQSSRNILFRGIS